MKKVDNSILKEIINIYTPNWRYLIEAHVEYPRIKGKFLVNKSEYLQDVDSKDKHLTDLEAQACLNQLCFVFFGQMVIDKKFELFNNIEGYLEKRMEMLITEVKRKFKKQIPLKKDFYGSIELINYKRIGDLYIAKINYEFAKNSCFGEMTLAMKS
jgi:hypothetical protein